MEELLGLDPTRYLPVAPESEVIGWDARGKAVQVSAGSLDPQTPVIPTATRFGRWPTDWQQEPLFNDNTPQQPIARFTILTENPDVAVMWAEEYGPKLMSLIMQEIGLSLLRQEPDQLKRFAPLSAATLAKRKREGRPPIPLVRTGDLLRRLMYHGFHTTVQVVDNEEGGKSMLIGYGPRPGDEPSPARFENNLFGRRDAGKGRRMIPARMPGLTPTVRQRIRSAVKQEAEQQSRVLSNESAHGAYLTGFSPDDSRPIFSYNPATD